MAASFISAISAGLRPGKLLAASGPQLRSISFRPHVHPQFHPLRVTLRRHGKARPLIIERFDYHEASAFLKGEAIEEFDYHITLPDLTQCVPLIHVLRSLDGTVEGLSIASPIASNAGDEKIIIWDRVIKFDRDPKSEIRGVGLAMLMLLLRSNQSAIDNNEKTIVKNIDNFVLHRFRCYFPGNPVHQQTEASPHSIDWQEGQYFLENDPFDFSPVVIRNFPSGA